MNLKQVLFSVLALTSFSASALEIAGAKLDVTGENLLVTVRHGGGCGNHDYKLVLGRCLESFPVQCSATIKHTTNDMCEAYLTREAKFNLKEHGLTDSYFKDGRLTIRGDRNTSATVKLSQNFAPTVKATCITHTGSTLVITDSQVTLTTKDNEVAEYNIVSRKELSLESYPPIDQTTLKLDDNRSIVTSFRSDLSTGRGYFIRLDGTISPEFSCSRK